MMTLGRGWDVTGGRDEGMDEGSDWGIISNPQP